MWVCECVCTKLTFLRALHAAVLMSALIQLDALSTSRKVNECHHHRQRCRELRRRRCRQSTRLFFPAVSVRPMIIRPPNLPSVTWFSATCSAEEERAGMQNPLTDYLCYWATIDSIIRKMAVRTELLFRFRETALAGSAPHQNRE